MNRAPTEEDRRNRVGLDEFIVELQKHGWVTNDTRHTHLKKFAVYYSACHHDDFNYMEWSAVLLE